MYDLKKLPYKEENFTKVTCKLKPFYEGLY
jgi:hypothetical protein